MMFKYNLQFLLLMPVSQDHADYIVLMGLRHYMISFQLGEWPGRKYTIEYRMDTLTIVSMEKFYFLSIFNICSKQEI